jgi:HD-GYP domain-containing protein (c-di-GMP phosphodiesterase class II)
MHEYSYLKHVEMSVRDLKIGMYVSKLDKPWKESSFLFQGFPIQDQSQINQLRKECLKVIVEFRSRKEYEIFLLACDLTHNKTQESLASFSSFKNELPNALKVFKKGLAVSQKIRNDGARLTVTNISECEAVIDMCITSLRRNKSVLLLLINLRNQAQYNVEHSFRVTILSVAFGIELGMSDQQISLLGNGAMLHDIGKSTLPESMLNKPDKLSKAEALLFKKHPVESFRLLSKINGVSEGVKEIALAFHEREDGKGYPRQIPRERVSRYAKIISIVGCYDAMISERPYNAVRSTKQAIQYLRKSAGSKYNTDLVSQFVCWLGNVPVGSLVEMNSGELGVAISNGDATKPYPTVALITDELKNKCFQKVIDLSSYVSNAKGDGYEIKDILKNNIYGINVQDYLLENVIEDNWLKKNAPSNQSPFAKYLS